MFSRSLLATFIIFSYTLTSAVVAQTCYLPDGTDRAKADPNSTWVFCKSTAGTGHGMCCDGTSAGGSTCVGNGLCHYGSFNSIFREGCTDPTWQDPSCLKLYTTGTDDSGIPRASEKVLLSMCNSTKYPNAPTDQLCPFGGPSFDSCCADTLGFKIGDNASVLPSNATSTKSASSSVVATTSAAAATSPASQADVGVLPSATAASSPQANNSSSTVNGGAVAGGIIGGIALGALLVFAAWFFLRRRKQQAGPTPGSEAAPPAYTSNGAVYYEKGRMGSGATHTTLSEMPAWQVNELPANRQHLAAEMEAPHHGYYR